MTGAHKKSITVSIKLKYYLERERASSPAACVGFLQSADVVEGVVRITLPSAIEGGGVMCN